MRLSRAVVRSGMQAEPNVTPFLDVLLVLLIIFMYLSLSQQKIVTAQLPDPSPVSGPSSPSLVLEVRPGATYAINSQVVTGSQLAGQLRAIYDGRPEKTLIVRAAPGVRYQEVVTAMDIAKGAGVVAIGLK
jgi:biopolymer transport protein TolR